MNDGEEHHVSFSWTNSSVKVVLDNGECIPNLRDCQVQVLVFVFCLCPFALSLSPFIYINSWVKLVLDNGKCIPNLRD